MTEHEFVAACKRICEAFPDVSAWVHSDEGRTDIQREIRRALLLPLDTRDVDAATVDIAMRPKSPWCEFGKAPEKAFQHVANVASSLAGKRSARSETQRLAAQARRQAVHASDISASDVCRDFVLATKGGGLPTAAARREWLDARLGEEEVRDAVRCSVCSDTGLVRVLSALLRARDGSTAWTGGVASCPCQLGAQFRTAKDEAWILAEYDDCEHVRIVPMATIVDIQDELVRTRKRREAKSRHGFLDDFNTRNAADLRERQREVEFV